MKRTVKDVEEDLRLLSEEKKRLTIEENIDEVRRKKEDLDKRLKGRVFLIRDYPKIVINYYKEFQIGNKDHIYSNPLYIYCTREQITIVRHQSDYQGLGVEFLERKIGDSWSEINYDNMFPYGLEEITMKEYEKLKKSVKEHVSKCATSFDYLLKKS